MSQDETATAAELADLRRRVRRTEDRQEIRELVTRYAVAADLRDYAALAECFDEEGTFASVGGRATGREALVDYYRGRFTHYGPTFHVPHSSFVDLDPEDEDRATGTVVAHSEIFFDEGLVLAAMHYHDAYHRGDDGRWRLESREVEFVYAMPLAELPGADWRAPRRRFPGTDPQVAHIPEGSPHWEPRA